MSGIEVYERARASGWKGEVLFVSGFFDTDLDGRLHGKPFLAKPFRKQALLDRVAQIMATLPDRAAQHGP
jgi:FixJ family two-component response regulator